MMPRFYRHDTALCRRYDAALCRRVCLSVCVPQKCIRYCMLAFPGRGRGEGEGIGRDGGIASEASFRVSVSCVFVCDVLLSSFLY